MERRGPIRGSVRLLFTLLKVLLLLVGLVLGQRTCRLDQNPARPDVRFQLCTDYSQSEACLAPIGSAFPPGLYPSEEAVARRFGAIRFRGDSETKECAADVRQLQCAAADPWSGTLFDGHDLIPSICPELSSTVWAHCVDVVMAPNPFSATGATASLRDLFPTEDAFAAAFRNRRPDGQCYSGVPVDRTKTVPELPEPGMDYAGEVCVRRLRYPVPSNRLFLGGAPYPTDCRLMAIIDKDGKVALWDMSNAAQEPFPFLDVSAQIVADGSRGLLSVAFHKDFNRNGRLFLSMTCRTGSGDKACKKDGDLVVDEYVVADPVQFSTPRFSKRILYFDRVFPDNIGGQLLFSPSPKDPNLFVMVGDGGQDPNVDVGDPFNNAQNLGSMFGKVLRIDVDGTGDRPYGIPCDNPFVGVAGAREEIYAFGFRNPWRCAFDRQHPEFLFCGDAGQHRYEEVDRVIAGGNYGWRYLEGRHVYDKSSPLGKPPLVLPEIEYNHSIIGPYSAIIGGYVYRPQQKSCIDGTYFFADTAQTLFSAIAVPGSGVYLRTPKSGSWCCASDSPVPCDADLGMIYSFFESALGNLYVSTSSAIYEIVSPSRCGLSCGASSHLPPN